VAFEVGYDLNMTLGHVRAAQLPTAFSASCADKRTTALAKPPL